MFTEIGNNILLFFKEFVFIYIFWIGLHYISVHLYSYFCTPSTFIGFLYSPFLAPLPQCKMLRWIIYNGGEMIEVMWIILGKWIIEQIIKKNLMARKEN